MATHQLQEWAFHLDRNIEALRGRTETALPRDEVLTLLDTSYAELRAASEEVAEEAGRVQRVFGEVERIRLRHHALLGLLPDGVFETDESGVIRWASDAAGRLLNVRPELLQGKPFLVFVAEGDRALLERQLRLAGQEGGSASTELRLVPRSGPEVTSSVRAQRLTAKENAPPTVLWIIRDPGDHADELRARRAQRDGLDQEIGERSNVLKDLDESIGDRLAGIRKLSRRVIEMQDAEGQKLARELRERFGQTLGAIKLNLENLGNGQAEVRRAPLYREATKLVDAAMQRLREIYFELSPPLMQGVGLVGMIRQMLSRVPDPGKLKAVIEADPLPLLSPQVESASMWVAREALSNVVRHSGATTVEVTVRREGNRLNLGIRDNGRGFNIPATRKLAERAGCFGLVGMEERVGILGGDLQILSAPRQGTEIRVVFPAAAR